MPLQPCPIMYSPHPALAGCQRNAHRDTACPGLQQLGLERCAMASGRQRPVPSVPDTIRLYGRMLLHMAAVSSMLENRQRSGASSLYVCQACVPRTHMQELSRLQWSCADSISRAGTGKHGEASSTDSRTRPATGRGCATDRLQPIVQGAEEGEGQGGQPLLHLPAAAHPLPPAGPAGQGRLL